MRVFFYGLFMDEGVLAKKEIQHSESRTGFIEGFSLRIGDRATLVRSSNSRAYGVVMDIAASEVRQLYAEKSVSDYVPEPVVVELMDGTSVEATCFNLPNDKVTGTNKHYARALLDVATRLNFPEPYLDEIRRAQTLRNTGR